MTSRAGVPHFYSFLLAFYGLIVVTVSVLFTSVGVFIVFLFDIYGLLTLLNFLALTSLLLDLSLNVYSNGFLLILKI